LHDFSELFSSASICCCCHANKLLLLLLLLPMRNSAPAAATEDFVSILFYLAFTTTKLRARAFIKCGLTAVPGCGMGRIFAGRVEMGVPCSSITCLLQTITVLLSLLLSSVYMVSSIWCRRLANINNLCASAIIVWSEDHKFCPFPVSPTNIRRHSILVHCHVNCHSQKKKHLHANKNPSPQCEHTLCTISISVIAPQPK